MIKEFSLENFKRFEEVKLELTPFTVLMGENGSGKTSLLQAIALGVRALATTDLVTYDVRNQRMRFRDKAVAYPRLPGLHVEDPREVFYAKRSRGGTSAGARGGARPIKLNYVDENGNTYKLEINSQFGSFTIKNASSKTDFPGLPSLLGQPPLFISGFVGITASEERFFPFAIQDRLSQGRASEILRNLLLDIFTTDPAKFERLRKKVKDNFNFEIGSVSFSPEHDVYVRANYKETLGRGTLGLDLSTAGSGFLQILQILTPIYRYSDSSKLVLLDEPDAHLHPNLQRTTARVLQEVAREEGLQVIISTHSTAIIREVDPGSVVPVTNSRNELRPLSTPQELEGEIEMRLDNYTSGKASIAGRVVFVEDEHTHVLERIDAVLGTGLFEGPRTVPIMSAQGKDDKVPFRIKTSLQRITGTEMEVFFIRDGDGLPQEWRERLEAYATGRNVELILLEMHEIENYLLGPTFLQKALQNLGVALEREEIEERLKSVMKEIIARGRYNFDKTMRDNLYKTGRLLNEEYSFPQAEGEAGRLRNQYEELNDFDALRKVAPGKEVLRRFLSQVKEETGIQISERRLVRELQADDVDQWLVDKLRGISMVEVEPEVDEATDASGLEDEDVMAPAAAVEEVPVVEEEGS